MPESTIKASPVVKSHTERPLGLPARPLTSLVDRTSKLSEEVLKSLESSERAAIEALGQFVIAIEEAFPVEVATTSDVAKKVTEAGLQMVDGLVRAQHDFMRSAIASAAKSLSARDGAAR